MRRSWFAFLAFAAALLNGCNGGSGHIPASPAATTTGQPAIGSLSARQMQSLYPRSQSPGSFHVPAMPQTPIQPASAMFLRRQPQSEIAGLGWTQLPGSAQYVTACPDGSLWIISNVPYASSGNFIYQYVSGTWTNISGAATANEIGRESSRERV
jgi:hypothetical protein